MRPTKPDGTSWSAADSNVMLQFFHRQSRDELNARDVARGLPKNLCCGRYVKSGRDSVFVVDPRLVPLKHSGAEFGALRGTKWALFCSAPRAPEVELRKIGEVPSIDETPRMHMQGLAPAIQEAIAQGIAAGVAAALSNGKAKVPARLAGETSPDRPMTLRERVKSAESEPATVETT